MKTINVLQSTIGKNSLFSVLDQILSIGMNLVLAILFARFLGPYSLGQYTLAVTLVGVIGLFANFGILPVLNRAIAKSESKASIYLGNALGIKFLISFPLLILLSTLVVLVLDYSQDTIYVILLVVIYNTLLSSVSYVGAALVSMHRNNIVLKLNVTNKSLSLFFAVILLFLGSSLEYLLYAFILVSIFSFILALYEIKRFIPNFHIRFDLKFVKRLIFISFPLVFAGAAEFISLKVDTIFIGSILSEESAGQYTAAYSVFMGAIFLPLALTKVFFPNFVFKYQFDKNGAFILLNRYRNNFLLYSVVVGLVFYFFAEHIVLLIFGDNFVSSISVLQLLSLALFSIVLNRLFNYVLVALKEDKYYLYISILGSIINVSLNFFLIGLYGIVGAAISTIITELTVLILSMLRVTRVFNFINSVELK